MMDTDTIFSPAGLPGVFPQNSAMAYEILLFHKLQFDPAGQQWMAKIKKLATSEDTCVGVAIPHHWRHLGMMLQHKKRQFIAFVRHRVNTGEWLTCSDDKMFSYDQNYVFFKQADSLLADYISYNKLTVLRLDNMFKPGEECFLPKGIFHCPCVRELSLTYCNLVTLPPEIGRLSNLQTLALSNNKLVNSSIPHTLRFCTKLETLLLDNNLLDALPGFLLKMTSLAKIYRHGNHNYFKSTFMWYHTDVNERILPEYESQPPIKGEVPSLQFWAAQGVLSSKVDFYHSRHVPSRLQEYISGVYDWFNICSYCGVAELPVYCPGYKVITFKNPYLGNACIPFQHWTCSFSCAVAIEEPARREQIRASREMDQEYDEFVEMWQRCFKSGKKPKDLKCSLRQYKMTQEQSGDEDSEEALDFKDFIPDDFSCKRKCVIS